MRVGRRRFAWLIASLLIGAGMITLSSPAQSGPDDPGFEFQWGLAQIGVQDAWAIGRGRGATVAVLDTGVDLAHEDLSGRLLSGGLDTVGDDQNPQDDRGEGTHVAGIVAASTNNDTGVAGIAYEASVVPIKVLRSDGDGVEADVIEGIRHAIERKVDVMLVNLDERISLGSGGSNFEAAIRDAWAAGVVPVVSADHQFVRSTAFSDAPALVVGGVTRDGNSTPDSNGVGSARWGIAGPGGGGSGGEDDIFSTYLPGTRPDGLGGTREYGRYVYDSGDIQAAAHVAGAAAILRGLGQTTQETVDRLLSSTTEAGPTGRDRTYGVGIVHAGRSVRGIPAQQTGTTGTGTATTEPPAGGGGSTGQPPRPTGGGAGGQTPPGETGPGGRGSAAAPPPGGIGTPSGAPSPGDPPALPEEDETGTVGDVADGLAASRDPDDRPGRTPLLPLLAFLLLVGSGTVAWALRRRTLEPTPPADSSS